jgi:hypothetical protein
MRMQIFGEWEGIAVYHMAEDGSCYCLEEEDMEKV